MNDNEKNCCGKNRNEMNCFEKKNNKKKNNKKKDYDKDDSDKNYYDASYYENYKSQSGQEYKHGHGWEQIFAEHAKHITEEIQPEKTLDVGCAVGFLVEALRDRGVMAYGIDISDYAISQVREDVRPYCKARSALLPFQERYDLITCIEVLEHLERKDLSAAIQNMCEASDDIIFSSTPFAYDEESHISVHMPWYWAEQFAYHGFYHDVQYDCSYISVQAMRFRKAEKNRIDLIREYESVLFEKHQELTTVRQCWQTCRENVLIYQDAYQKHVDKINQELNPKILELEEACGRMRSELEGERGRVQLEMEKERSKMQSEMEEERSKMQSEMEQELEKAKTELEGHYSGRLEEEVRKRKYLEEEYYKKVDALKEVEDCRIELDQAMTTIAVLQKENDRKSHTSALWYRVARRLKNRRMERKLLCKGLAYWNPVFEPRYYAEHNQDVYEACGMDEKELLKHFICYGMQEGRRANEEFDIAVYMRCNPDMARIWKFDRRAGYLHYITDGMAEQRRAR